jgi:hypothetical protein
MRLPRLLAVPLLLVLAAACGGSGTETLSPSQAVRAAAASAADVKSARMSLVSTSVLGTQTVKITGTGAYDYTTHNGTFSIELPGSLGGAIEARTVDGVVYLQLPTDKSTFYSLKASDIATTSFGAGTDPSAGLAALQGVSSDVRKVGSEEVRGARTTHYAGTYDVQAALSKVTGPAKDALTSTLAGKDLSAVPFDAYIDDSGRMRKFVQTFDVTGPDGKKLSNSSTLELFDFGAEVKVTAPPASQVKDGAPLLDALKGAAATKTG